jgi:hypothetical protein
LLTSPAKDMYVLELVVENGVRAREYVTIFKPDEVWVIHFTSKTPSKGYPSPKDKNVRVMHVYDNLQWEKAV